MPLSTTRVLKTALLSASALVLGAMLLITLDGLNEQVVQADLAVVPGNTVDPDGTPSRRLRGRLERALELYRSGHCKAILVSGGVGSEGFDEARVMQTYLLERGVPPEQVYTDSQGLNTFATARFTATLVQAHGWNGPLLVSQFFHLSRFKLALKQQGVPAGGQAHSRLYELRDVYATFREVFAYLGYVLRRGRA